jgi:type VI secretion system protein
MLKGNYLPRLVLIFACGVCAPVWLTACFPKVIRTTSKLTVKVDVSARANNNNPVALDLVLVKDKKLFKELMKISAAEWFEKRSQYRLDYPKEIGLSAGSWEWVPGQVVTIEPIPFKFKVAGGLVFANYLTPGAHRAVIDASKPLVITLGAEGISVTPEK